MMRACHSGPGGLYIIVAHSVGQRTHEIGVRMAIGARAHHIAALVCRQGLVPSGVGLGIGLAASLAVNRVLASMLVRVSTSDPLTLSVAAAALAGAALLGCLMPTWRALRQSPVVALRHE
jgi:putative ABC transport system permease protein